MFKAWSLPEKMKNSVLNITVSGFASATSTEPKEVNLLTWLNSEKYRHQVDRIRQAASKEERTELKKRLPAITPSGTFTRRNLDGLVKHSGLICLDIDRQDNESLDNFGDIKNILSKIENIAYCGLSVSGNGFYCLVPIERPDLHKLHFEALSNDLRRFSITVDRSGSDVTRLRFYSYDPEAYFNHHAKIYRKLHQVPPPEMSIMSKMSKVSKYQMTFSETKNHFLALLKLLTSTGTDITNGYKNWFEVGCGIASEFGEVGRSYFHEISRFYPGYQAAKTDRQFNQCLRHRYQFTIKTFFHYAKLAGLTLDRITIKNSGTITGHRSNIFTDVQR